MKRINVCFLMLFSLFAFDKLLAEGSDVIKVSERVLVYQNCGFGAEIIGSLEPQQIRFIVMIDDGSISGLKWYKIILPDGNFGWISDQCQCIERLRKEKVTLEIWTSSDYTNAITKNTARLKNEFKKASFDFEIAFKHFSKADFYKKIPFIKENKEVPDLAFIDNFHELAPLIDDNILVIGNSLPDRFGFWGNWLILKQGAYQDKVKTLVRWILGDFEIPSHFRKIDLPADDLIVIENLNRKAIKALFSADNRSLNELGGEFILPREVIPGLQKRFEVTQTEIKGFYGNSKFLIVFTQPLVEKQDRYGKVRVVSLFYKEKEKWWLLGITSDTVTTSSNIFESLKLFSLNRSKSPASLEILPPPRLISPPDGEKALPPPNERFGYLIFEPLSRNFDIAGYILEMGLGSRATLESRFFFKPNIPALEPRVSAGRAYGGGGLWRVLAIDKSGEISISKIRKFWN